MKTLIFSSMALVGVLLVALQHQQIGRLRTENASLQQTATEADQLRSDLAKSTDHEAVDADEIDRLREENRDLLKLRNEVGQLRDARAEFEKVTAENQRLQSMAKSAVKTDGKQSSMRSILIRVDSLYDRGQSTPENSIQTLYWSLHGRNREALSRCLTSQSWRAFQEHLNSDSTYWQNFGGIDSIEIVAQRSINTTTVQLGLEVHTGNDPQWDRKIIFTLVLQGGDWRVDANSFR